MAVWLTGAFPGATAEVSWGGAVHGSAVSGPDGARFSLNAGLPSGAVTLTQVAPVGSGPPAIMRTDPLPLPADSSLPPPKVGAPLIACQRAVAVSGVFDGATVILTHKDSSTQEAGFDQPGLWFGLPPLVEGDTITARQEMRRCKLKSANSAPPTPVGKAQNLPAPTVLDPLCVGAVSIRVIGLVPGSIVHLKVGATTYSGMAAQSANWADFFVAPLTAVKVSATQEACSVTSPASREVTVKTTPAVTTPATIKPPLLECGRGVPVENAHVGALLQVWAKHRGADAPISGLVVAGTTDFTIPVAPYLRRGDRVRVIQYGCSANAVASPEVIVAAHAQPNPPRIATPAYAELSQVTVVDVLPGAQVDVYVERGKGGPWVVAGSTIADSAKPTVGLNAPLAVGDNIRATQTLCGTQTEVGPTTVAVAPPPKIPIITAPTNGATNVPKRPHFTWNDPGAGTAGAATSYEVQLLDGSTVVIPPTATGTNSFTPGSDLNYKRKLTFQVRAKNASGTSGWGQVVFTTQDAPAPVAPLLTKYDVPTKTLTGSGFLHSATVHVRLSMVGNSVYNNYGYAVLDTRDVFVNFHLRCKREPQRSRQPDDGAASRSSSTTSTTSAAPGEAKNSTSRQTTAAQTPPTPPEPSGPTPSPSPPPKRHPLGEHRRASKPRADRGRGAGRQARLLAVSARGRSGASPIGRPR